MAVDLTMEDDVGGSATEVEPPGQNTVAASPPVKRIRRRLPQYVQEMEYTGTSASRQLEEVVARARQGSHAKGSKPM